MIYGLSGLMDRAIQIWYLSEVKSELKAVFEGNKTVYMDGGMLSIYLLDSRSVFELEGKKYDSFSGDEQYNELRGRIFRVERMEKSDIDYLITSDESKPIYQISSVYTLIKVRFWRKVITNVITIAVAGLLLYLHERKNTTQKKEEKFIKALA
jgi:hypothetical protein